MILVTFALPLEGRFFEKSHFAKREDISILYTGVGRKRAELGFNAYLAKAHSIPKAVIVAGFGGGLEEYIQCGDVIVDLPEKEMQGKLESLNDKRPNGVRYGVIRSADLVVNNSAARCRFGKESGAIAVDMESDGIRAAALRLGIPVIAIRAVTDSVRNPMPLPPEVLFDIEAQKVPYRRLLPYLARKPEKIASLWRFSGECQRCSLRLKECLEFLLQELLD